jgi:hypothetical protein
MSVVPVGGGKLTLSWKHIGNYILGPSDLILIFTFFPTEQIWKCISDPIYHIVNCTSGPFGQLANCISEPIYRLANFTSDRTEPFASCTAEPTEQIFSFV